MFQNERIRVIAVDCWICCKLARGECGIQGWYFGPDVGDVIEERTGSETIVRILDTNVMDGGGGSIY